MRQTSSSTAYTSDNNSDYIFSLGTSSGGRHAANPKILSQVVTLSPNSTYYVWFFMELEDISNAGYIGGSITVNGLNR